MVFREILNQICAPIKMIEHNHYFFFYLKFKALCFWQKRLKGIEFYFTFLHKFKRRKKLKQKSFSSPGDFFRMVLNKIFIFLMQFLYRSSSRWFFFPIFRFKCAISLNLKRFADLAKGIDFLGRFVWEMCTNYWPVLHWSWPKFVNS